MLFHLLLQEIINFLVRIYNRSSKSNRIFEQGTKIIASEQNLYTGRNSLDLFRAKIF